MKWERFYDKAYNWVLNIGPRIIIAIVVLFIGIWLIRLMRKWANHHMNRRALDPSVQPFLISLFITGLQVVLILTLMQILGLQMTIFTALIGAIGVAAGLALSGTLQNFTSGILILFLKPFRVGDNIVAQGQEGTVTSIQIFYTVVLTYDNTTVIIPNSKLSNEVIINLSREGIRRLDVELKLNYGIAFDQINAIVQKSIQADKNILPEPSPRIGVSVVEADGFKMMISVWTQAHGFKDEKLAFQERIIEDIKSAGVKLPGM